MAKYFVFLPDVSTRSPRFSGQSWLAFPALRAAYKRVQMRIEFRPETLQGILFLTGERDDMAGDFMALILHHGYLEFRFDCGSGVGVVRSDKQVLLNQWNHVTLYRHRWDAWLQLNDGAHIEGRSKVSRKYHLVSVLKQIRCNPRLLTLSQTDSFAFRKVPQAIHFLYYLRPLF